MAIIEKRAVILAHVRRDVQLLLTLFPPRSEDLLIGLLQLDAFAVGKTLKLLSKMVDLVGMVSGSLTSICPMDLLGWRLGIDSQDFVGVRVLPICVFGTAPILILLLCLSLPVCRTVLMFKQRQYVFTTNKIPGQSSEKDNVVNAPQRSQEVRNGIER
jgi:hypothetical protein